MQIQERVKWDEKIYADDVLYCTQTSLENCKEQKYNLTSADGLIVNLNFLVEQNDYTNKVGCKALENKEYKIDI